MCSCLWCVVAFGVLLPVVCWNLFNEVMCLPIYWCVGVLDLQLLCCIIDSLRMLSLATCIFADSRHASVPIEDQRPGWDPDTRTVPALGRSPFPGNDFDMDHNANGKRLIVTSSSLSCVVAFAV